MDDVRAPGSEGWSEEGLERLADAVEQYETGDYHTARQRLLEGCAKVGDPEALAEAEALRSRLRADRASWLFGLGCLLLWIALFCRSAWT